MMEPLQAELCRRLLHGLSLEWEAAIWTLPETIRRRMKRPVFSLIPMKRRLGYWSSRNREIALSESFVLNHSWDSIREVLHHEMAHQAACEAFGAGNEPPHGPAFRRACALLYANPRATDDYPPLDDRIADQETNDADKILDRIKKLLSLAQSDHRHEAEAAMLKAHELMRKYHVDLIESRNGRDYLSVFIGRPALRRFRECYALAHLLQDFYFVKTIWVNAYVLEKERMGRVLEISGAPKDLQIASYVHDFVSRFIDREWGAYNRDHSLNRYRKTDFALGILRGFRSRLPVGNHKTPEGSALMIPEDPRLTRYFRARYPRINTFSSGERRYDPDVLWDGVRVGKTLVISQGITHTRDSGKLLE